MASRARKYGGKIGLKPGQQVPCPTHVEMHRQEQPPTIKVNDFGLLFTLRPIPTQILYRSAFRKLSILIGQAQLDQENKAKGGAARSGEQGQGIEAVIMALIGSSLTSDPDKSSENFAFDRTCLLAY